MTLILTLNLPEGRRRPGEPNVAKALVMAEIAGIVADVRYA
jgi:hypothetical protein